MDKTINALGLMSGTSMDGIDASLIKSNGEKNINIIGNLYKQYDSELKNELHELCKKINTHEDLEANIDEIKDIERKITIKHSEIVFDIQNKFNIKADIIGFHGQTIIHKPQDHYSIQIGNAKLLAQLSKIDIVSNFRKNDIEHGGEGAPLTPIYHHNLKNNLNLHEPVLFLNIGGIANYTFSNKNYFCARDVGPGNCLMDELIKATKNLDYDKNGSLAASGKVDKILLNSIFEHEYYATKNKHSLDIKDFDINIVKGIQIEDALATLNYFSAKIIFENIKDDIDEDYKVILCGGGRKNQTLVSNLEKLFNKKFFLIDDFKIDGDYIESQAFAYMSIRSLYKKNISFPDTTKVKKPITGGELTNFN